MEFFLFSDLRQAKLGEFPLLSFKRERERQDLSAEFSRQSRIPQPIDSPVKRVVNLRRASAETQFLPSWSRG